MLASHSYGFRKQEINIPLRRGLRFMIGKTGTFISFNESILSAVNGRHNKIDAHNGDVNDLRCPY